MKPLAVLILFLIQSAVSEDEDPEISMTTPEIIAYWGYPVETHQVTTSDGYIIDVHRIPHGKNDSAPSASGRPVVFFQHGFMCSSSNWIVNLPDESAGFIFADAGFDVWLGNMRGNTYAKNHKTLDPKSEKFWEFSFDEHQQYDLPAMVDYALSVSNQSSLYYVGHSQGTLIMFAHLSENPTFASKIKKYFALAPISTVHYVEGLMGFLGRNLELELDVLYHLFGSGEFLPSSNLMKLVAHYVCGDNPTNPLCDNVLFLVAGPESNQFNDTRSAVYVGHTPAGVSTQNVVHWLQMIKSDTVQKFDYEKKEKNMEHYGQEQPPLYDYSKVNAPVYLYWSDADYLGDKKDIESYLLPTLPKKYLIENNHLPDFNHLDFIWGMNAPKSIYYPIINTIKKDL